MSCLALEVSQVTYVCAGPRPAGLTELTLCWKAQEGSVADERGEAGCEAGLAAQGSFCRTGSYLWGVINLLPPAREQGLLRKAVRARSLFILFPSF